MSLSFEPSNEASMEYSLLVDLRVNVISWREIKTEKNE